MAKDTQIAEVTDEPKVNHDDLISQILARSDEEYARGSDAAESGALTKTFLEETGLNSQAFSWAKTIIKKIKKKDGQAKAMDVIRSMNAILPMLENHVLGQGTAEMDLEPDTDDEDADDPDFNDDITPEGEDQPVEGEDDLQPVGGEIDD